MGDEVSSKQSASVSRISLDLKKLLDAASPNVALKLILDVNPPPDLRNIIDRTPAVDGLISAHPGYEKERLKLIEYLNGRGINPSTFGTCPWFVGVSLTPQQAYELDRREDAPFTAIVYGEGLISLEYKLGSD
ncbi:MAG TPA: hypothetical protein VJI52_00245 [Candidatus Nanoarchaeia archaeon]|nr:hypothetical protein [Candidatus Nanoarchaeia archaeon]